MARHRRREATLWRALKVVMALAAIGRPAAAETDDICANLARESRRMGGIRDATHLTTFTYRESGRVVKTFRARVMSKMPNKSLVDFISPGDMRGTRILIADPENMYVYLPEFRRVRRIAGHSIRQPFMGTNIYFEDVMERRHDERWTCRPLETTEAAWIVELRPRPGVSTAYDKLRMEIDRQREQPRRIDYWERAVKVRTLVRDGWQTFGEVLMATRMVYRSHDRDAELTIELSEIRVNSGLSSNIFSRRTLIKGF